MILAVTGLKREAKIAAGDDVIAVSGGGDRAYLEKQIDEALAKPLKAVISFGVAGALAPALKPGDCVLAARILDGDETFGADEAWTARVKAKIADVHSVVCSGAIVGTETVILGAPEKAELFRRTHALAVDMESHIAARAAKARGLPFIAIRTISDGADRALPPAARNAMKPGGGLNVMGIAGSILTRPGQIPDLIRTGRESEMAFAALLRCRDVLGGLFAFADLG